MAVEITKFINKNKLVAGSTNYILKIFFNTVRNIHKLFPYKSGNIVVISLSRLGDSVFTIPAINEVQNFYKKRITVLCHPDSVPIYNLVFNGIGFCIIDQKQFLFNKRMANRKARKKLKSLQPEILFDLSGMMTSAFLIFNSRAREIVGMNREQFKGIYDRYIPVRKTPHLMDMYLDVVASVIPVLNREQKKLIPENFNNKGKILIHPFAGWRAKEWNFNKFMQLAVKLKDKFNVSLIVPVNIIPADVMVEAIDQKIEIIQTHSIQELIGNIKECSIFIGNDSGPLYIASLLAKPTFAIYGPTNPEYSLPLGHNHSYIRNEINCSPKKNEQYCFTTGGKFGCPAFQCMNQLNLEQVYSELLPFVVKFCSIKENNFENTERKS